MTDITTLAIYHDPVNEPLVTEIKRLQMELRALRQDNGAVIAQLQNEIKRLKYIIGDI